MKTAILITIILLTSCATTPRIVEMRITTGGVTKVYPWKEEEK